MRKPRRVLGEGFAFCTVFPVIMMTMGKSAEWHIICSSHAVLYVVKSTPTTLGCVGRDIRRVSLRMVEEGRQSVRRKHSYGHRFYITI